jgi:beta-lactamase regulating signal transducer with metallopeptidase domain
MTEFLRVLFVSSVSGTIIAILLFLIKPFIKDKISKKAQYYSWYLVFLRILLLFTISNSLFNKLVIIKQNPFVSDLTSSDFSPSAGKALELPSGTSNLTHSDFLLNDNIFKIEYLYIAMFIIWLIGMLTLLYINIYGYIKYTRQINLNRIKVENSATLELLDDCRKKLNISRSLPLYVSSIIDTPMLCGIIKSAIIIPDRSFTQSQLKHAFLHELVHYKHRDNILKWVIVLANCIHWFNPFIYFAVRECSCLCELSCDEIATADFTRDERISYGRTLLNIASKTDVKPFALSASLNEDKQILKERLETLMVPKKSGKKVVILTFTLLLAIVMITVTTILFCGAGKPAQTIAGSNKLKNQTLVYKNENYGFLFTLPENWKGYKIVMDEWQGYASSEQGEKLVTSGPIIKIRNPKWTSEKPMQDIPIMVFTQNQWTSLQNNEFFVSAAPILPSKLGSNQKYVFALPARYNYAFLPGYEEVEKILEGNPLKPFDNNVQSPENKDISKDINLADGPSIINNVSDDLKTKYSDLNITNEWLSSLFENDERYIVLFGSLKDNNDQGFALVLQINKDCTVIKNENRFTTPNKNGAIKVIELGAKDTTMIVMDDKGIKWNFQIFNGFDQSILN